MTGRPTKLDDLIAKRISDALEAGASRRCAAHAVGIDYSTLKLWLSKGRRGDPDYSAFSARIDRAEAKAERTMSDVLFEAGKSDPKWAESWLSRRRAVTWARRDGTKRPDAAPTETVEEMSAETVAEIEELLAACKGAK